MLNDGTQSDSEHSTSQLTPTTPVIRRGDGNSRRRRRQQSYRQYLLSRKSRTRRGKFIFIDLQIIISNFC